MIEKLIKFQIKYHKILLIVFLLFFLFSLNTAKEIQIDASFSSLIDPNSEYSNNFRAVQIQNQFTDSIFILLSIDESDKFSKINSFNDEIAINYVENLRETLLLNQYITSIPEPQYSDDLQFAKLELLIDVPKKVGGSDIVFEGIEDIIENNIISGIDTEYSGSLVITERIVSYLINDNITAIIITISLIFIILYIYSRDIMFTLVVLTTPVFVLTLMLTFMVLVDIPISLMLASLGVLALGLGVDYAVHLAIHYKKAREKYEHEKALIHTVLELKIALLASFLTTFSGFLALMFASGEATQNQGILLSLAIALVFALSFTSFPIFLTNFYKFFDIKENKVFNKAINMLIKLASFQAKSPRLVIGITFILTLVMLFGAMNISMSTDSNDWIPDSDRSKTLLFEESIIFGNSAYDNEVESISYILVSTQGDLRNIQIKIDIDELEKELVSKTNVISIQSVYRNIDQSQREIYDILSSEEYKGFFNEDYTFTQLSIEVANPHNLDDTEFIDVHNIVNSHEIYNSELKSFDSGLQDIELGESLVKDMAVTTLVSFLLVFLIVTVSYWSFKVGFISIGPIFVAIIWTVGIMGFTGVPFTQLSIGVVSLVLGIGIDFAIHLVDNIQRNLRKFNLDKAIKETLSSSGSAILLSSITTFFGFLALLTATLQGTKYFGLTLAIAIFSVLVISIVLIPAIFALISKQNIK